MLATVLGLTMMQATINPKATMGRDLYHDCSATVSRYDSGERHDGDVVPVLNCLQYVRGFYDAFKVVDLGCFTSQTTTMTVVRLYVNYMRDHPKLMDDVPAEGLLMTIHEAFACVKQ